MFGRLRRRKSTDAEPWTGHEHVSDTADGWSSLFRHRGDGSLWERTYPQGENHGGGSATFNKIGRTDAQAKYGLN